MPLVPLFQYKAVKFVLGPSVDIASYETWLLANPLAEIVATSLIDGANDGPTLVVTYRKLV